jgi:hypothetical protein
MYVISYFFFKINIPLVKTGNINKFFPDFLIWSKNNKVAFAVDTKGEHLLKEAIEKKLPNLNPSGKNKTNLVIYFVSKGKWDKNINLQGKNGYTLWAIRKEDNEILPLHREDLSEIVKLDSLRWYK